MRTVSMLIAAVILVQSPPPAANLLQPSAKYVCPPCEHDGHGQTWSAEGTCPTCHMRLMRQLAAARQANDEGLERELSVYLDEIGRAGEFSGAVLLARHGKTLVTRAYGYANRDFSVPNRVDTRFNLGSMNKMFTAVAIAQLVEAGKLSFDEPLVRILPDALPKADAGKIQIKHLLTHTSGLGDYLFTPETRRVNPAILRTVDDWMARIKDDVPAFPPGTRSRYSNTGFLVLGKVVEKVSGQTYYDYVREHITAPAGMRSTQFSELDRVNSNLAEGYSRNDPASPWEKNLFAHVVKGGPAGGGFSTVEDLHRFALALTSGKLVRPETFETLVSAKPELNSPGYGFGFRVDGEEVGHSGGAPGISAVLTIFRTRGYVEAVLSNETHGHDGVSAAIRQLLPSR